MKYLFVLISLFVATLITHAQPKPVEMRMLQDHYFAGDESLLEQGLNTIVLTSRKEYEKYFGTTSRPDTPHFSKEWMLILVLPTTKYDASLVFERVSVKAGDFMEVYCNVDTKKKKLTYDHNPLAACVVPKQENISKVDFYNRRKGLHLMSTVNIRQR
ncbi:MAG: hypothetical protein R2800_06530 [Flavipsychrobacter sp.]